MPADIFVSLGSAILAALALVAAMTAFVRSGELATPWILFLCMSAFDIFLPAAAQTISPDASIASTTIARMGIAVSFFAGGLAFFGLGHWCMSLSPATRPAVDSRDDRDSIVAARAELVLVVGVALHLSRMWREVGRFESLSAYLVSALTNRFATQPSVPLTGMDVLISRVEGFGLPLAFLCIGILLIRRRMAPIRFGVFWPVVGLALTFTTMFRGTLLLYLLGLITIETLHRLSAAGDGNQRVANLSRWRNRLAVLAIVVVLAFVSYGSLRAWLSSRAWGASDPLVDTTASSAIGWEVSRFVRGEGLLGLSLIIENYPRRVPYLGGKTIIDMLLLPVPRAFWPEKPAWYGIDDISRSMGLPSSSQSAVTMPGELFANFGPWGLPLMLIPGAVFGLFYRWRFGRRFRYLYAFHLLPLTLTSFWMSFSGFVNGMIFVPVLWAVLVLIIPRGATSTIASAPLSSPQVLA